MSFRRNRDQSLAWKHWVDQHRDELISSGVPSEVFSDEHRWNYLLAEDGVDWKTGWRVKMLSPQQAEVLHRLITAEFSQLGVCGCLRPLMDIIQRQDTIS